MLYCGVDTNSNSCIVSVNAALNSRIVLGHQLTVLLLSLLPPLLSHCMHAEILKYPLSHIRC